jgi:hypothetical protein
VDNTITKTISALLRRERAAWILAAGLVLAALINGGVHQTVSGGGATGGAYCINRFTGSAQWILWHDIYTAHPKETNK